MPTVSIVAISYNQEKFIAQALDSFLMQKTDFDFEIVIGDDCSTDNTAKIIQEYANKHPKVFNAVLRKKNIGVQPNLNDVMRRAKGKYLALCEGDDYWTDPTKLQRQVDFLESHKDYALCFHLAKDVYENSEKSEEFFPNFTSGFSLELLLTRNFIRTASVMYRKQDYSKLPEDVLPLDWYYHVYHAQFGKIGFIDRAMSVYRKHPGGVWWNSNNDLDGIWQKHGVKHLSLYVEFLKLVGTKEPHRSNVLELISKMLGNLIQTDATHKTNLLKQVLNKYPDYIEDFLIAQNRALQGQVSNSKYSSEINKLKHELRQREKEIDQIKSSKLWKLRKALPR